MSASTPSLFTSVRPPRQALVGPAAVLLCLTLSLPTALGSIALGLFALAWLAAGGWACQWQRWRASPTALWAAALLLMFGVGALYGSAPYHQAGDILGKYAKLLVLVALLGSLTEAVWQRRALHGFMLGAVVASLLSYARFAGLVPAGWADSVVQGHIHFGTIEAFAAYLFARQAFEPGPRRWLWALVAAALAFDVIYICIGRTGYVVLFALIVLLAGQRLGTRGVLVGGLVALVLAAVAFTAFPVARQRLDQGLQNLRQYERIEATHQGSLAGNSWGLRLRFWHVTLHIIEQRPLLGSGTGSLPGEYARVAPADLDTSNAHNEFLNTTEQIGLVGLFLLLGLGAAAWRDGARLTPLPRDAARAVLVTIGVGSLFNSLLMDVNEGRFLVVMLGVLLAASVRTGQG